ncbi:MAG TPA: shikimate dehydrogenase [Stenotrophobium sp.]|jgi:shikimate dehydrogenase|nr:shikimate dehydrogenase [Stenotrophobium sp.]
MDRYAVIGQPVAHSKSPYIHNEYARQTAQAMRYEAVEVGVDALVPTLKRLHDEGYLGVNITLPHKVAVAALCETISERAALAGAVNTLIRTDTGWRGDNTDGEGLVRDITQNLHLPIAGKRVLLLGAGGAARGLLKPLLDEKPASLTLTNRNPWKPEELAMQFKAYGPIQPCTHLAIKGDRFDLIIHATSAGHSGTMPRIADDILAPGATCYDLSYGKAFEVFAAWARTQGATRIADGLGMLVEQAAAAFRIWRGVEPDTAAVIAALHKTVGDVEVAETSVHDGNVKARSAAEHTAAAHSVAAED